MTLSIGTRVVRGPDWGWGDQDRSGVGTVIKGHLELFANFTLNVRWPDGTSNRYRYTDLYKDVVPLKKSTFEELM